MKLKVVDLVDDVPKFTDVDSGRTKTIAYWFADSRATAKRMQRWIFKAQIWRSLCWLYVLTLPSIIALTAIAFLTMVIQRHIRLDLIVSVSMLWCILGAYSAGVRRLGSHLHQPF